MSKPSFDKKALIAFTEEFLEELDNCAVRIGFESRSELVRQACREFLVRSGGSKASSTTSGPLTRHDLSKTVVSIPTQLLDDVDAEVNARGTYISRSSFINQAIREYLHKVRMESRLEKEHQDASLP